MCFILDAIAKSYRRSLYCSMISHVLPLFHVLSLRASVSVDCPVLTLDCKLLCIFRTNHHVFYQQETYNTAHRRLSSGSILACTDVWNIGPCHKIPEYLEWKRVCRACLEGFPRFWSIICISIANYSWWVWCIAPVWKWLGSHGYPAGHPICTQNHHPVPGIPCKVAA